MPSLSNLRSRHAVGVPEARAMLTMPLLAVAADGRIDGALLSHVLGLCGENPILRRLGTPVLAQLGKAIMEDMVERGAQVLFFEAVETLPQSLRETALCFAIRLCCDDGHLDPEEHDALSAMAESMDIDAARFCILADVMMTLQRGDAD